MFIVFSILMSAKAQLLDPSVVLKQDGVLRITDGSSYFEFSTNGVFKSFPVPMSGRTFTGTWTSSADRNYLSFTVTAREGWMNGAQPPPDVWRIVFAVGPGLRSPTDVRHLATFDGYYVIEELTKIAKPDK